jgi:hypothetical protein
VPVLTVKVIASLLQIHGPGATIQSDHQGIDALLGDIRGQIAQDAVVPGEGASGLITPAAFIRGGGGFRRVGGVGGGGFRRGAFLRA